jgi:uncharacterized membrane protein
MDTLSLARALHVLAVVHWIGGVSLVTLVLLPGLIRAVPGPERLALFEMIEGRFGAQARISTLLAGASGLWMTSELDAWGRFLDPATWWMAAMLMVWALFTLVLFIAEPLVLHRWFQARSLRDPEGSFALVLRLHRLLLALSVITVLGAVLGAHGAI